MSERPVKRLSQLEIDEVSLVDRPANQHGLVTITKRDEGSPMGLYDEQGNEVDETQLQSGDVVFDEDGEQIVMLSDDDINALLEEGIDPAELGIDDRELVGVGKAAGSAAVTGGPSTITRILNNVRGHGSNVRLGFNEGRGFRSTSNPIGAGTKSRAVGQHLGRNRLAYGVGAAAGTEENARGRFRKSGSLGQEVLTELSKALTDGDRDQVISKAMGEVEKAYGLAEEAISKAEQLAEENEFAQFVEVAKGFELPVETTELAGLLQSVSKALSDDELDLFERILYTAANALDLEERGSAGTSPVMGYVQEGARELVGKAAGEITEEQATVALFSADDEAYLAYLSENQR